MMRRCRAGGAGAAGTAARIDDLFGRCAAAGSGSTGPAAGVVGPEEDADGAGRGAAGGRAQHSRVSAVVLLSEIPLGTERSMPQVRTAAGRSANRAA